MPLAWAGWAPTCLASSVCPSGLWPCTPASSNSSDLTSPLCLSGCVVGPISVEQDSLSCLPHTPDTKRRPLLCVLGEPWGPYRSFFVPCFLGETNLLTREQCLCSFSSFSFSLTFSHSFLDSYRLRVTWVCFLTSIAVSYICNKACILLV